MARTLSQGPVTRPELRPARPADAPAIRELLRRQAMGGMIRLSLEREPDHRIAAGVEGERHHTFVVREPGSDRILGMGSRAVRRVWVNARPARLGYLAQLRRAPELARHRRLLAAGYAASEKTRRDDELPYDLTSIVADNTAARRLLERALPGMPIYRPLCELVTLTIPVGSRRKRSGRVRRGSADLLPAIAACLERNLRRYQFAPIWTVDDLRCPRRVPELHPEDFFVTTDGDRVTGCLARWDQRRFKQVVVRGYAPPLARWRRLVNVALAVGGRPRLPAPGRALKLAYLSHLAVDDDCAEVLIELIRAARHQSAGMDLDYLVTGLTAANPMLPALRRAFPARELASILYLVHRPGAAAAAVDELDGRLTHVEVATL